jgi:hypothetical protein
MEVFAVSDEYREGTGSQEATGYAEAPAPNGDGTGTSGAGSVSPEIQALKAQIEALQSKIQGQEYLLGKWSNEVGELRKLNAELQERLAQSAQPQEDIGKKVAALWEAGNFEEAARLQEQALLKRAEQLASQIVTPVASRLAALEAENKQLKLKTKHPDADQYLTEAQRLAAAYQRGEVDADELLLLAAKAARMGTSPPPQPKGAIKPVDSVPPERKPPPEKEPGEPDYKPF